MKLSALVGWFGLFLLLSVPDIARADDSVLRVPLNTELQVLDPVVTTINATRVFAYVVFGLQLVGIDNDGRYHPQMLRRGRT